MTIPYSHDNHKFASAGLQLRVPPDMVPPLQFSKLTNCTPIIEGQLEARSGLKFIVTVANINTPGSGMHSITRLNQTAVAVVGDRIAGVDTTVQTFALPSGTTALLRDSNRTGDPLTMADYHFNQDTASWEVLADRQGANRYRSGNYVPLGMAAPVEPILSVVAGAAGNLNNGAGPAYDWRITHVNTITQSESNPSPVAWNGNEDTIPTANTAPDPNFGGSPATAHTNVTGTLVATSAAESRQSCLWSVWGAAASKPYSEFSLAISGSFVVTGTSGAVYGAIYFSLDGGTTWKLYTECSSGTLNFGYSNPNNPTHEFGQILIDPGQDLSQIQVRAVVMGCGSTSVPQNVTARRIRSRGGNFSISDLLVGANATTRQITLTILDIHAHGVQLGATIAALALANQQANICIIDPRTINPPINADAIRLYRRGGTVTASWAFSGQYQLSGLAAGPCGANNLQVIDNVADANLGGFISFTNDAPISSVYVLNRPLPYIWGPGLNPARLFGCGDPDRPDAVYFSNPGNADQWGIGQWIDVSSPSDPMQNGCVFNTRIFAFSKERMFELLPSLIGGATLTPSQTPCSRGLASPYGLVSTARAIYFVAKDGIYRTLGGEEESLVENDIKPLFPSLDQPLGRSIEGYEAVDFERIEDIRLEFHNDELYFKYIGITSGGAGGHQNVLVYDQNRKRWRAVNYGDISIASIYSEQGTQSSLLLGSTAGGMYSTQAGTGDILSGGGEADISVVIRTGAYDQGMPLVPKEYGPSTIDIDPGGATLAKPVTITPLFNGEAVTAAAIVITGSGRQRVPITLSDFYGYNVEFQITFSRNTSINPVLYQFDVLYRPDPTAVIHWEAPETAHGLNGYQHIRDMNIPIRSTADVTLTLSFDGGATTQTYTIPSTAGQRKKVYVPMHANKFKVVRYSLDSTDVTQPFRAYIEDLEVRVKPWVADLGYAVTRPFGAETQQAGESLAQQLTAGA